MTKLTDMKPKLSFIVLCCLIVWVTSCSSVSVDIETYEDENPVNYPFQGAGTSNAPNSAVTAADTADTLLLDNQFARINFTACFAGDYYSEGLLRVNIKSIRIENEDLSIDSFLNIQEPAVERGYPAGYTTPGILIRTVEAVELFKRNEQGNEQYLYFTPVTESMITEGFEGKKLIIEYDMIMPDGDGGYIAIASAESRIISAQYLKSGSEQTFVITFRFNEISYDPVVSGWDDDNIDVSL